MSGRIEQEKLIEDNINKIIQDKPRVIREYSKSFRNKTVSTKRKYILQAIEFLNYIKEEFNIDITNIENYSKINYAMINSYMDDNKYNSKEYGKNKTDGTCAAEFYSLKNFCKFLYLSKYISENPCNDIEPPKDKKEYKITSLTPREISQIKKNIMNGVGTPKAKAYQKSMVNRDMCIIMLGLVTGLRASAIRNIDIKDIDFENKTIKTIEKGNFERTIFISDEIIDLIRKWMNDREIILDGKELDALFISTQKKRIGRETFRNLIDKYTYNINKHITPHKLRSTTATNLLDKTGDIYLVAEVLGHHNIQNTKRYAKPSTEKRKVAAEIMSKFI